MMMRSPTMADDLAASPLTSANVSSGRHDPYELNVKIMIAAVVVLLAVILFILALHLYAKWFWRSSHFGASRRLRNQDEQQRQEQPFVDDDPPFFNNPAFGLDKAFLDALPTFTFKQQQSEESEVESGKGKPQPDCCAVCISEFQEGDAGRMLPKCGHAFHTSCIDMWLHCHTTCPLCRTGIVSNPWESRAKADADAFDVRLLDTAVLEGLVLAAAVNNSGTSSASDEIGLAQGGGDQEQQVQHLVIEIPVVDSASTSSLGCCPQQLVPKSRWRSLRRMLSRECKVVPSGSSSPSTLSRTSSTNVTSSSSASAEAGECSEDQQQQLESGSNRYVVLLVE